jgi:hypothetical protein
MHLLDYSTKKCCKAPLHHFPGWNDSSTKKPAGCIHFCDGSLMEGWQYMVCGKIPAHPNTPPIQKYSDHESDNEEEQERSAHPSDECIIQ